jgi:hypothetical protein
MNKLPPVLARLMCRMCSQNTLRSEISVKFKGYICHTVALPFTLFFFKKGIFIRQKKEELWKLKLIFHHAKKYNLLPKILYKKPKSFKRLFIITLGTNLKFQHKPRISTIFPKSSYKNRPIIIYLRAQNLFKATTMLYDESKHNILCLGRQTQ